MSRFMACVQTGSKTRSRARFDNFRRSLDELSIVPMPAPFTL